MALFCYALVLSLTFVVLEKKKKIILEKSSNQLLEENSREKGLHREEAIEG